MSAETAATPSVSFAFTASAALSDSLQRVLVDLIALGVTTKQAHWNIVGENFRDLHLNFDEVVDIAREGSDEVAERMRAINAVPDGRPATVAAGATVPSLPKDEITVSEGVAYVVSAIEAVVSTLRGVHDAVDDEDPASAGILEDLTGKLEQQAWFISSEDRKPVRGVQLSRSDAGGRLRGCRGRPPASGRQVERGRRRSRHVRDLRDSVDGLVSAGLNPVDSEEPPWHVPRTAPRVEPGPAAEPPHWAACCLPAHWP